MSGGNWTWDSLSHKANCLWTRGPWAMLLKDLTPDPTSKAKPRSRPPVQKTCHFLQQSDALHLIACGTQRQGCHLDPCFAPSTTGSTAGKIRRIKKVFTGFPSVSGHFFFLKKLILTLGLEFSVFSFEKEIGMGP